MQLSLKISSMIAGAALAAATLLTAAPPASAGPLCSTFSNIPLASFISCVVNSNNDKIVDVQNVLNDVLEPNVTLIGSQSYYPGPPSGGKAGEPFTGDRPADNFDINPNTVAGSISFEFLSLPPGTDFIVMKQATSYEIFNVVGLTLPFTLTHQLLPNNGTSHISTYASDAEPPRVPEPASMALLGSALIGFGLLRRRKRA